MNILRKLFSLAWRKWFLMGHAAPAVSPPSSQQSQPAHQPFGATAFTSPQDGHVRRNKILFRPVGPSDVVEESKETWMRNGLVMEGETVTTKAITASGQIVDVSDLKSICFVCHLLENDVIRSDISHVPLCHTCKRIFQQPSGETIVVTPQEYLHLMQNFDTWALFDAKQKRAEQ